MAGEDFAFYQQLAPGVMFGIGIRSEEAGVTGQEQPAQAQPAQQPTAPAWITYQRRGRRPSG